MIPQLSLWLLDPRQGERPQELIGDKCAKVMDMGFHPKLDIFSIYISYIYFHLTL